MVTILPTYLYNRVHVKLVLLPKMQNSKGSWPNFDELSCYADHTCTVPALGLGCMEKNNIYWIVNTAVKMITHPYELNYCSILTGTLNPKETLV